MSHFSREHLSSSRQKCGGGGGVFYLVKGAAHLCVWLGGGGAVVVGGVKGQGPAYLGHHWLSVYCAQICVILACVEAATKGLVCSCVWIVVRCMSCD